jgi:hypothetical protein
MTATRNKALSDAAHPHIRDPVDGSVYTSASVNAVLWIFIACHIRFEDATSSNKIVNDVSVEDVSATIEQTHELLMSTFDFIQRSLAANTHIYPAEAIFTCTARRADQSAVAKVFVGAFFL